MDYGRTILFVPGDQPRRIRRAFDSAAESVVVDLEDAVELSAKASARESVITALQEARHARALVRVNGAGTPDYRQDLRSLRPVMPLLSGIVLPKAESATQLQKLDEDLTSLERDAAIDGGTIRVIAVLESARGVLAAHEIATSPRVTALMFGTLDLSAELGVTATVAGTELLYARSQVVLASKAARLSGPLDGPHAELFDDAGLTESSKAARSLGFTGRVVLHPRQIDLVNSAFAPSYAEVEQARAILEAYANANANGVGVGALRLPDGTFIDRPVLARARAVIGSIPDRELTT